MTKFSRAMETVCREPYRLFFPLGIFAATVGIGHWYLYGMGLHDSYSGMFHSTVQVLVYMNCFILGFLLTALPRFTSTPPSTKGELAFFVFVLLGIFLSCMRFDWIMAESLFVVWLLALVRFVLVRLIRRPRHSSSSGVPPKELIWIPFGIFNGILGTMLLILAQTGILPKWALTVGKPMMDQGFLLSIVIGIGGFLIPRLMGTYASAMPAEDAGDQACRVESALVPKKLDKISLHILYALMLFVSFWIEGLGNAPLGHALQAAVVTAAFLTSRALLQTPRVNEFYVKMAYTSVWMTAAGYWGAALLIPYEKEMLHLTFIGGFSLMTFAVATMVIMTHAGATDVLRKPFWILWVVVIGLGAALAGRLAIIIFPEQYFKILGYSAACWIITAAVWLLFMMKYFFKVPRDDEFERMHQSAKERLQSREEGPRAGISA